MRDVNKWLAVITLAVALGACAGTDNASSTSQSEDEAAAAADETKGEKASAKAPVFREVTVPAGTTMRLDLASSISSDVMLVGRTIALP